MVKRRFFDRYGLLLICFIVIGMGFIGLAPLMRESDQASILTGALDLSWGGSILGNEAYRYDKFYGTYWVLALSYKLLGVEQGDNPHHIVYLGNIIAFSIFSLSLIVMALMTRANGKLLITATITLISPVILFSAALVSPNIFSIAWIFLLIGCLAMKQNKWSLFSILVSSFLAVACRLDAVLVMPALALFCSKQKSLFLWKDLRVISAFIGSVTALLISRIIGGDHTAGIGETFFFNPKAAAIYLLFGLGSTLGLCFLFTIGALAKYRMRGLGFTLAALLPLLFYLGLLFTPRHLSLVPIVILASCLLPRGRVIWKNLLKKRSMHLVWLGNVAITVCLLFIGLKLPSLSSPSISFKTATRYPTADGYWPMGGTLKFLYDLGNGVKIPIDHNQTVWESWLKIANEQKVTVFRDKLFRYPELAAKIRGWEFEYSNHPEGAVFSERVIRRLTKTKERESWPEEILSGKRGIFLQNQGDLGIARLSPIVQNTLSVTVAQLSNGQDTLLVATDDPLLKEKILPFEENNSFVINVKYTNEKVEYLTNEIQLKDKPIVGDWLVIHRLPPYMQIK